VGGDEYVINRYVLMLKRDIDVEILYLSVCPSDPSVCPSHIGIASKRLYISSNFFSPPGTRGARRRPWRVGFL